MFPFHWIFPRNPRRRSRVSPRLGLEQLEARTVLSTVAPILYRVVLDTPAATTTPIAGVNYQPAAGSGAINLTNANLDVTFGPDYALPTTGTGRSFQIMTGTSVTGHFAGADIFSSGGKSYLDQDGHYFTFGYTKTTVTLTEAPAPTVTTLTYSSTTATFGQNLMLTATVKVADTGAAATGSVGFDDGAAALGGDPSRSTVTLVNGQGVLSFDATHPLPALTYNYVDAVYAGNGWVDGASQSLPGKLTIGKASDAITLSPASTALTFGTPGSGVTATVASPSTGLQPSGSVLFTIRGATTTTQTIPLQKGTAQANLSGLRPLATPYVITAQFLGNGDFTTSTTAKAVAVTVARASTSGQVTISQAVSTQGSPVSYSLLLSVPSAAAGIVAPTGIVQFLATKNATSILLGTAVNLTAKGNSTFVATCPVTSHLAAGIYTITARYSGNGNYLSSSATTTQTVNKPTATSAAGVVTSAEVIPVAGPNGSTTVTLTLTPSQSTSTVGDATPTTYMIDINVGTSGNPAPTGSTVITATGANTGDTFSTTLSSYLTADNVNYTATWTPTNFAADTYTISAVFAGDSNYSAATSGSQTQTVTAGTVILNVTAPGNNSTVAYGVSQTYTATIGTTGAAPSGTTTFYYGSGILIGSTSGSSAYTFTSTGTYTVNVSNAMVALPVGTQTIYAVYSGDPNYSTATSASISEMVTMAPTTLTITNIFPNNVTLANATSFSYTAQLSTGGSISGATPPAGQVVFTATNVLTGATISLGTATTFTGSLGTYTTTVTAASTLFTTSGAYTITAAYSDSTGDYVSSNSSSTPSTANTQNIDPVSTLTFLEVPTPVTTNVPVTYLVELTVGSGGPTPTGTLSVSYTIVINTIPVNVTLPTTAWSGSSGVFTAYVTSSFPIEFPSTGTYLISASFAGDSSYEASTATSVNEVVVSSTSTYPTEQTTATSPVVLRDGTATFNLTVTNNGSAGAAIYLLATLPSNCTLSSGSGSAGWTLLSGNVYYLATSDLPVGQTVFQFAVTVPDLPTPNQKFTTNTATSVQLTTNLSSGNSQSTATEEINPRYLRWPGI